jgi:hypothetical protein
MSLRRGQRSLLRRRPIVIDVYHNTNGREAIELNENTSGRTAFKGRLYGADAVIHSRIVPSYGTSPTILPMIHSLATGTSTIGS